MAAGSEDQEQASGSTGAPVLVLARGARAAEAHLVQRLAELRDEARREPALLARPVRVVVPSGALRDHVAARVAHALESAVGLQIQTLDGLAFELLARSGETLRRGELLLEVLVRRAAQDEPSLAGPLGALEDGYGPLVAAVRDLLDAGLDDATREAFDEAVAALLHGTSVRERIGAVVRVLHRVRAAAREADASLGSDHLARACALVEGGAALPTRALFVYGFADVTARAGELLEALARTARAEVVLDRPPDPGTLAGEEESERSARFADPLQERFLALRARVQRVAPHARRPPDAFLRAPGREAEVRATASAIRAHLDAGLAPERIAIVARDLGPYRAALAIQLRRLGIPYACARVAGHADADTGRIAALAALLEGAERTFLDRWLDALVTRADGEELGTGAKDAFDPRLRSPELRLALRVLGLTRLGELATRDLEALLAGSTSVALPMRRGGSPLAASEDDDEEGASDAGVNEVDAPEAGTREQGAFRRSRARVPSDLLFVAQRAARGLLEAMAARPAHAAAESHGEALRALARERLGWRAQTRAMARLEAALARIAAGTAGAVLDGAEFTRLAARTLAELSRPPLGGAGGGVRVLDAMDARGRAFTQLYLLGLERDAFPRAGGEDPLLPDGARRQLAAVLPELPIKARRRDEERYLFAQLLASAEQVRLSWPYLDEDGVAKVRSPLVARLLFALPGGTRAGADDPRVEVVPPLLPTHRARAFPAGALPARTAVEAVTLAFLQGGASESEWIPALAEAGCPQEHRAALAAHRAALLAEVEGRGERATRLGPFFGLVGDQARVGARPDPWRETQPITALERFARCPWQLFLQRVLGLERLPDPMAALPTIDALQLGSSVHRALEAVALGRFPDTSRARPSLAEVEELEGEPARWPATAAQLDAILTEAARRELSESGVVLPGLVRALAARARPYVLVARERVGDASPLHARRVVGAEVDGRVEVQLEDEAPLTLTFRADRVDKVGTKGFLELIDFKTGKPFVEQTSDRVRPQKILHSIESGRHLQGIAYALGARSEDAVGRYVFLKEGLAPLVASTEMERVQSVEQAEAFREAVGTLAAAWRAGAFFPRLVEPAKGEKAKDNPACRHCEVAEACPRGDSGARRRELDWEASPRHDEGGVLAVARSVWFLGVEE